MAARRYMLHGNSYCFLDGLHTALELRSEAVRRLPALCAPARSCWLVGALAVPVRDSFRCALALWAGGWASG